jgi:hypothetical protein
MIQAPDQLEEPQQVLPTKSNEALCINYICSGLNGITPDFKRSSN